MERFGRRGLGMGVERGQGVHLVIVCVNLSK